MDKMQSLLFQKNKKKQKNKHLLQQISRCDHFLYDNYNNIKKERK